MRANKECTRVGGRGEGEEGVESRLYMGEHNNVYGAKAGQRVTKPYLMTRWGIFHWKIFKNGFYLVMVSITALCEYNKMIRRPTW